MNKGAEQNKTKLPAKKSQSPDGFTDELYKTFKKEWLPIVHKLKKKKKIEEEGIFPNSFCVATIGQIPKNKDITRKLGTNIPYEYRCKSLQQYTKK